MIIISNMATKAQKKKTVEAIVAMRTGGLSVGEIADETNTSTQNISAILKRYNLKQEHIHQFTSHRVSVLRGLQDKIAKSVNQTDTKKAGLYQKAASLKMLHEIERLEEGKSTANVALHSIVENIEKEDRNKKQEQNSVQ